MDGLTSRSSRSASRESPRPSFRAESPYFPQQRPSFQNTTPRDAQALHGAFALQQRDEDVERKLLQLESRLSILEAEAKSRSSEPDLRRELVDLRNRPVVGSRTASTGLTEYDDEAEEIKKRLSRVEECSSVVAGQKGYADEAQDIKKRLDRVEECLSVVTGEDDPTAQGKSTVSLQQLLQSMLALEQQVSTIQEQRKPSKEEASAMGDTDFGSNWLGTSLSIASEARRQSLDNLEYKFERSVWDLSLFIGTPLLSPGTSAVVTLCFIFNVVLLICFIDMCFSLAKADFDETSQHEFHIWRSTVAHNMDFQNSVTGESLAHGVCNELAYTPTASHQLAIVLQLRDYLEDPPVFQFGLPKGVWMCWLSIIVWYLTLTAELRQIGELSACFAGLPIESHTKFEKADKPNRVQLAAVSPRRVAILVVIVGLRLAVMVILGYIGTFYLCYEVSVEDMILNSVALELMLNFDDMVFESLMPAVPQQVVKLVTPLQKKRSRMPRLIKHWDRYGMFVAIILIYMVLGICVYYFALHPFVDTLRANLDALCGAPDLYDFIVTVDAIGVPWAAYTPSWSNIEDEYAYHAVTEALKTEVSPLRAQLQPGQRSNLGYFMQVDSGPRLQRLALVLPEFWIPKEWSLVDPRDLTESVGWEEEFLVLGNTDFGDIPGTVYNHYLQFLLGESGNVNCSHVPFKECTKQGATAADVVMKQLCPNRCGCGLPTAGTVANPHATSSSGFLGCAAWNTRKPTFVDSLDSLPCTDTTSVDVFVTWASGVGDYKVEGNWSLFDGLMNLFRTGGCNAVVPVKIGYDHDSRICAATSLPAICPESCGCNKGVSWTTHHTIKMQFCPFSCQRTQPLCVTAEKFHDYDTGSRGPWPGFSCVFPFYYKGVAYHTCTTVDWTGPWCSVAIRSGINHRWGDCPNTTACIR